MLAVEPMRGTGKAAVNVVQPPLTDCQVDTLTDRNTKQLVIADSIVQQYLNSD